MQHLQIHIPLAKIDEEKRLVIGRAVHEVPDRSGEIIDYATARGAFETWSKTFSDMTGGLSKGNLRVMHDPKRVAGKVVDLQYNDDEKAIEVVAKVVDPVEWQKVVEGVYTGFSVGGKYANRWTEPNTGLKRYTPEVTELSLVDLPCIPTARIAELVKADGTVQELALRGRPPMTFSQHLAKMSVRSFVEHLDEMRGAGRPMPGHVGYLAAALTARRR